jgi:hypothetical protein
MSMCVVHGCNFVAVGAFSISWTSVASSNKGGLLDSKTMVIVLSCVSAAGALLAACCFYFVCCGRRRRAGVSCLALSCESNGVTEGCGSLLDAYWFS